MSLTLAAVLESMRQKHPAFDDSRVPGPTIASELSDYQNTLIGKAVARSKGYLLQTLAIGFRLEGSNIPGTAGAGTTPGLPGTVTAGVLARSEEVAGGAPAVSGATVAMAERAVTSATSTTTTSTGAGRGVDADLNKLLSVSGGKGFGQVRKVISNTATVWTHAAWAIIPDATSLIQVLSETLASTLAGVFTEIPAESRRTGYLVKSTAAGVAYIDYTDPLVLYVGRGVPLPANLAVVGGTVRYADGEEPLRLTSFERRFDVNRWPAVYELGGQLFACGTKTDWVDVESVEVLYTPIAPALTLETDLFLVPDGAKPCLVAYAAACAAVRAIGYGEKLAVDITHFQAAAARAEDDYLSTLRLSKRGRVTHFRQEEE